MSNVQAGEPTEADGWQAIADSALNLGRRGETREALAMLQQAIEQARQAGDRRGETIALNGAALMHSIRGDYWSALASSMDAFVMARAAQDRRCMAHALTMLAGALLLMTPIDSEIALLHAALKIAETEEDLRLQVRIHNLLGILLGDLERFGQAEVHLDLALVLADCSKDGDTAAFDRWRLMANIANLLRKRAQSAARAGMAAEAAEHCAAGLELIGRVEIHCIEYGKVPILLDALRISAMLLAVQGRVDLAHAKFVAAWKLAIERRQRSALPALGVDIARMLIDDGRLDAAEITLAEALREAALYRPSPKAAGLCELMAEVEGGRGDRRAEAQWLKDALIAHNEFEVLKREARRQMAGVAQSLDSIMATQPG